MNKEKRLALEGKLYGITPEEDLTKVEEIPPVLKNAISNNPELQVMIDDILAQLYAGISVDLVIAGFSGTGKTTIVRGLVRLFNNGIKREVTSDEGREPRVVVQDLADDLAIGRDIGTIKSPVGYMEHQDYLAGEDIEREVGRMIYRHLKKPILRIQESIVVTQNFDKEGRVIGNPRIGIEEIRRNVQIEKRDVRMLFISMDEDFRRNIVLERMSRMKSEEDLAKVGNPRVAMQQPFDMLEVLSQLYREGVVDLGYTPFMDSSRLKRRIEENPDTLAIFENFMIPRLVEGIYGEYNIPKWLQVENMLIRRDKVTEDFDSELLAEFHRSRYTNLLPRLIRDCPKELIKPAELGRQLRKWKLMVA